MAGESEQMPSVVDELVDIHSADEGRRALLRADEVNRQQENETGENRPRQQLANRDNRDGK